MATSPGGHDLLSKSMIEDFCSNFTPGGMVVYVAASGASWVDLNEDALAGLGVRVHSPDRMPDLVVHMPDRNWLFLMEGAARRGALNAHRRAQLTEFFAGSTARLVFVSCFSSRAEMQDYFMDTAWETAIWCADEPKHLIHLDGERLFGASA